MEVDLFHFHFILLSGTICNTEAGPDQGFCEDINECLPGWVDPRGLVTVDGRTDVDGVRR